MQCITTGYSGRSAARPAAEPGALCRSAGPKLRILDIFSKRQKRLRGEVPDVYNYDEIPNPLRVQIIHIWWDVLGGPPLYNTEYGGEECRECYRIVVEGLCREYGLFQLPPARGVGGRRHYLQELADFLLQQQETEHVLDAIELSFRVVDRVARDHSPVNTYPPGPAADSAINELNARFREHGVGFHFSNGELIRIDSELVHTEVVKPALRLLSQPFLRGAQEEFLRAHEHYRAGNSKEALNEALKSFESTLKSICVKRKWSFPANATSSALIDICFQNGLIPTFWQSQLGGLRTLLESGVPTARNRMGGHGQGEAVQTVPNHIVSYVLHMTASAIVFLAEAEAKTP